MIVPPRLMCGGTGTGKTTAERLLMISHVNGLIFDPAVDGRVCRPVGCAERSHSCGGQAGVAGLSVLDCLNTALDYWTASGARLGLISLLNETFAALAPR
jgi:hypothetical protein